MLRAEIAASGLGQGKRGASVEGEVGTVAYTDKPGSVTEFSDPEQAARYANESTVDALAVSVGTTHRSTSQCVQIQYESGAPGSGVPRSQGLDRESPCALVRHGERCTL